MGFSEDALNKEWQRLEESIGGRFRDDEECPPIARLFHVSNQAVKKVREALDNDPAVREHLEVCSVCQRTFRTALLKLLDEEQSAFIQSLLRAAITKTHGPVQPSGTARTMADEWAESVAQAEQSEDSAPELGCESKSR